MVFWPMLGFKFPFIHAEGVVADEPVDYPEPPELFLSYQWGHQNEVKLIQRHLEMAGYKCWMDVGQMGGGDKLFEKIDSGIRAAKSCDLLCDREICHIAKLYQRGQPISESGKAHHPLTAGENGLATQGIHGTHLQ